jgi:hypothetical protein
MEFGKLREELDNKAINIEIDNLLKEKATADEKYEREPNSIINKYLSERIEYLKTVGDGFQKEERDTKVLDQVISQSNQRGTCK